MSETPFPILWLIPLAPLCVAALLLPLAAQLPRGFAAGAALLAWLVAVAAAGHALVTELELGHWELLTDSGFAGHLLVASAPFGGVELLGHPLTLLLAFAVVLGGGLALLDGVGAWGGGARRERSPASAAVLLGELLIVGLGAFAALAQSLAWTVAALVLASLASFAVLLSSRPGRDELDAAGRLFLLHRAGDAALVLALVILSTSFRSLDPIATGWAIGDVREWQRAASGPLAGFPAWQLVTTAALLLLAGAASRLSLLPLPLIARSASGAPASTLAVVHALGSFALGAVLLLRAAPVLVYLGPLLPGLAVVAAATALVSALSSVAERDVVHIDVRLLHAYAALAVTSLLLGQYSAAVLIVLHGALLAPLLAATTGAAVEALQGRTDVFDMGGLWRPLRRTDLVRALAVLSLAGIPGLAAFFALERTAFEAFAGPFSTTAALALLLATTFTLSLGAFRALHLVFSGDVVRGPAPARLVEVPAWRWLGPLVVALAVTVAGFILAAPRELVALLSPGEHQEPFLRFLEPSLRLSVPRPLDDNGTLAFGRRALSPSYRYALMASVGLLGLLGFVVSALLYRKGPSARHAKLAASPVVKALAVALGEGLWLERGYARVLDAVIVPVAQVARAVVFGVLGGALLQRPVLLVAAALRGALRLVHNGDVQRALAVALLFAALLLTLWGRS